MPSFGILADIPGYRLGYLRGSEESGDATQGLPRPAGNLFIAKEQQASGARYRRVDSAPDDAAPGDDSPRSRKAVYGRPRRRSGRYGETVLEVFEIFSTTNACK